MKLQYFIKIDVLTAQSPDRIWGTYWLATLSPLFVLVLCLPSESRFHSLDSHLLSTLIVPEVGDLQEKRTPFTSSSVSIRWIEKRNTHLSHTLVPTVLRVLNCRAMNSPRLCLKCVGAQVRLITWHPSKWCSLNSFLTLREEQLSARERKKKETGSFVQWSQEHWANVLHWDGEKMNAGGATTKISVLLDLYFDEHFFSEGMSWT